MRDLQQQLDALREENKEACRENAELKESEDRLLAVNAEHLAEIKKLREQLQAAKQKAAQSAPPPAAAPAYDEEMLERTVVAALTEALADGDTWEATAGAARRRADVPDNAIAAAAVRTAKRAQSKWAAEHARVREEARVAASKDAAKAVELGELQEGLRRAKMELKMCRRSLQESQGLVQSLEQQVVEERKLQALADASRPSSRPNAALAVPHAATRAPQRGPLGPSARPPLDETQRARYNVADVADDGPHSFRDYLQQSRHRSKGEAASRLPALGSGGPAPAASSGDAAMRSMQDTLRRQWRDHVHAHQRPL